MKIHNIRIKRSYAMPTNPLAQVAPNSEHSMYVTLSIQIDSNVWVPLVLRKSSLCQLCVLDAIFGELRSQHLPCRDSFSILPERGGGPAASSVPSAPSHIRLILPFTRIAVKILQTKRRVGAEHLQRIPASHSPTGRRSAPNSEGSGSSAALKHGGHSCTATTDPGDSWIALS